MNKIKWLFSAWVLISGSVWANVEVSPMSTTIASSGVSMVKVISKAEDVRYIKARIVRVTNPGTKQEAETEENIASGTGLIVTPMKLVLAAGQKSNLRIVNVLPPATESVYRIYIESLPSKDGKAEIDKNKLKTEVGIDLVWGVVVHVKPENPKIQLMLDKSKQLYNTGNIHVKINKAGYCPKEHNNDDCQWQKVNRNIYPHQVLSLPGDKKPGFLKVEYYDEYTGNTEITDPLARN
jgi:P pilus assembly chaperone PapD